MGLHVIRNAAGWFRDNINISPGNRGACMEAFHYVIQVGGYICQDI